MFGGNVIFSRKLRLKSKIHTNENVSELDFTYMYRVSGDFSFSYFFFNLKRMDVLVAIFNFNVPARTMNAPSGVISWNPWGGASNVINVKIYIVPLF